MNVLAGFSHPAIRWFLRFTALLPPLCAVGIFLQPSLWVVLVLVSAVSLWFAIFVFHRDNVHWGEPFHFFAFLALCVVCIEILILFLEQPVRQWVAVGAIAFIVWTGIYIHTMLHADPLHYRRRGFQQYSTAVMIVTVMVMMLDAVYIESFLHANFWFLIILLSALIVGEAALYWSFFGSLQQQGVLGLLLVWLFSAEFFWVFQFLPTNPMVTSLVTTCIITLFIITYRDYCARSLRTRQTLIRMAIGLVVIMLSVLTARW